MGRNKSMVRSIRVDDATWLAAKVEAVKRGRSLQEYVAEALQEKLDRDESQRITGKAASGR